VFRHRHLVRDVEIARRRLTAGHAIRDLRLFDGTTRSNRFDDEVPWESSLSAGPHDLAQAAASRLWGSVDGILYRGST
jgi:hypothetical protein